MPKRTEPWVARFKCFVKETNGCHLWNGGKEPRGYGRFWLNGKTVSSHVAALLATGLKIPPGMTVDHLCKNKRCVRKDHLEIVTMRTNVLRSDNACAINARKTHCKNGHILSEENVYRWKSNPNQRQCKICWRATTKRQKKLVRP